VNDILIFTSTYYGVAFEVFTRYSKDFSIIAFFICKLTCYKLLLSSQGLLQPGLVTLYCRLDGQLFLQPQTVPHSEYTLSQLQKLLLHLPRVYTEHATT